MPRKSTAFALLTLVPAFAVAVFACTGDDELFDPRDAGTFDGTVKVDSSTQPGDDSGSPRATCGDAGGAPPRVLLTIGRSGTSEVAAVNLDTKTVDGRLSFAGNYGATWSVGSEPYLLAQQRDVVSRLDPHEPWKVLSSWNVAGDDARDGGPSNANPSAIAVPACGKGYVLRFNRNRIAVIDTSVSAEAGAPEKWIDLSPLVQPNDSDGVVEMTGAIWVASKKLLYVLLGNVDLKKVAPDGFTALCADTKPTLIAIDTDKDELVSLGGTGPGGGIALEGYNTLLGSSFLYDAARERFLVLQAGCNIDKGGAAGAMSRRRVEEIDLATGKVKTLLSLDGQGFPSGMAYADATHAAITFFGQAFFWNPTETTLGPAIKGGLDLVTYDGRGNFVGPRATFLGDGGSGPLEIVSVPTDDAGAGTKITEDPFTSNAGFVSGAEVWPHR